MQAEILQIPAFPPDDALFILVPDANEKTFTRTRHRTPPVGRERHDLNYSPSFFDALRLKNGFSTYA